MWHLGSGLCKSSISSILMSIYFREKTHLWHALYLCSNFFRRAFNKDVTNTAPEASKKPKVRFEALFCFSDEPYTVFVCLCLVPVPKASFKVKAHKRLAYPIVMAFICNWSDVCVVNMVVKSDMLDKMCSGVFYLLTYVLRGTQKPEQGVRGAFKLGCVWRHDAPW